MDRRTLTVTALSTEGAALWGAEVEITSTDLAGNPAPLDHGGRTTAPFTSRKITSTEGRAAFALYPSSAGRLYRVDIRYGRAVTTKYVQMPDQDSRLSDLPAYRPGIGPSEVEGAVDLPDVGEGEGEDATTGVVDIRLDGEALTVEFADGREVTWDIRHGRRYIDLGAIQVRATLLATDGPWTADEFTRSLATEGTAESFAIPQSPFDNTTFAFLRRYLAIWVAGDVDVTEFYSAGGVGQVGRGNIPLDTRTPLTVDGVDGHYYVANGQGRGLVWVGDPWRLEIDDSDILPLPEVSFITEARARLVAQGVVADWAEQGNVSPIPEDKIPGGVGVGTGGLTQAEVDERVRLLVADWAESDNTADIPADKLDNAPQPGVVDTAQLLAAVRTVVADWAEEGNLNPVPFAKLGNVDLKVAAWARAGNTDDIPASKLGNAPSGTPGEGGAGGGNSRGPLVATLTVPAGSSGPGAGGIVVESDYSSVTVPDPGWMRFPIDRLSDQSLGMWAVVEVPDGTEIGEVFIPAGAIPSTPAPAGNTAGDAYRVGRIQVGGRHLDITGRGANLVNVYEVAIGFDNSLASGGVIRLYDAVGGGGGAGGTPGLTAAQARQEAQAVTQDWAEEGNTDPIPADKLTNAPQGTLDNAAGPCADRGLGRRGEHRSGTRFETARGRGECRHPDPECLSGFDT